MDLLIQRVMELTVGGSWFQLRQLTATGGQVLHPGQEDPSTRTTYNLGVLTKLVSQPATSNYWHEVTYTFRAKGYDVLQLRGDPDGGVCGVVVTDVRAFEQPWD